MRVVPRAVQDSRFKFSAQFSAAHRLLRKHGFDHVLHAEAVADRHFKIFFVRNINANAKLGIIVGKKTLPRAVDRNYVKRIIRETFRQHSVKMRNIDFVVMLRRPLEENVGAQVELNVLFSRAENKCAW